MKKLFGEIDSHTKVICTAFMCLQFGFVNFWRKDFGAKAAHKMLVKLTPAQLLYLLNMKLKRSTVKLPLPVNNRLG
jgi:hypothetical protein